MERHRHAGNVPRGQPIGVPGGFEPPIPGLGTCCSRIPGCSCRATNSWGFPSEMLSIRPIFIEESTTWVVVRRVEFAGFSGLRSAQDSPCRLLRGYSFHILRRISTQCLGISASLTLRNRRFRALLRLGAPSALLRPDRQNDSLAGNGQRIAHPACAFGVAASTTGRTNDLKQRRAVPPHSPPISAPHEHEDGCDHYEQCRVLHPP